MWPAANEQPRHPWPLVAVRHHGALALFLIGFFGWATAVPLYGSVGQSLAALHQVAYGPLPLWFLSANIISSVLWGIWVDARPDRARRSAQGAVAAAIVCTLLLGFLPPVAWPGVFAAMGLAIGAIAMWGRWYATTVEPGWLGRVFAVTAAGISLLNWLFALAARHLPPTVAMVLTLIPLVLAMLAAPRIQDRISPARLFPAARLHNRVKGRTVMRYGLFIIFFSLVAGLSYRFLIVTPITPFVNDTLRRLPYMAGVLVAGAMADRRNLQSVLASGAGLLALSFLIGAWGEPVPQYISIALNGAAFGLLEPTSWLLLASQATRATAGRWFGWGLNLNIVPIIVGSLVALPLDSMSPERLGLLAAVAIMLAILSLVGVTDPLTVLHNAPTLAVPATEAEAVAAAPATAALVPTAAAEAATPPPAVAMPAAPELLAQVYGQALSQRELEIGQLAIVGIASRDIAQQLYLSENTVKTHLRSVYRKTQSANRNDLYRQLIEGSYAGSGHAPRNGQTQAAAEKADDTASAS